MTVNTPAAAEPQGYQAYQAYSSAGAAAPPAYQHAPPAYQAGYQGGYNAYPATGIPLASGSSPYPGYVQGGYAAPPQVVYSGSPRVSGDVAIVYVPGTGYGSETTLLGAPLAPATPIEDTCPIFLFVLGFCFPILWCGGWLFVSRRYGSTTRIFGTLSAALAICAVAATIIVIILNVNQGPVIDYASSSSSSSYPY